MEAPLKKLECDPKCGFMIQSHDEKELIDVSLRHAKEKHGMKDVKVEDIKKMMVNA